MAELKKGFTTGSAATAASAAALTMLLSGKVPSEITIVTPKGISYTPKIEMPYLENNLAHCAVKKDGGDDYDITTGMLVYSEVRIADETDPFYQSEVKRYHEQSDKLCEWRSERIIITGGEGIGKVTRPGLDMPVGESAINSTPRKMIIKALSGICDEYGYDGKILVKIYVPEGEERAKKTFNSHMGIVGGISIIGTSGIVEPMSEKALIDTIRVDLSMQKAEGMPIAVIVPGNYGEKFLESEYNLDKKHTVQSSNFVGRTIDMCKELGFTRVLMAAHTGKFIKVAGGIMNTHSFEADGRMQILTACAIKAAMNILETNPEKGAGILKKFTVPVQAQILDCVSTTAGLEILEKLGLLEETARVAVKKIQDSLIYRSRNELQIECILYENSMGELAATEHAHEWMSEVLEFVKE